MLMHIHMAHRVHAHSLATHACRQGAVSEQRRDRGAEESPLRSREGRRPCHQHPRVEGAAGQPAPEHCAADQGRHGQGRRQVGRAGCTG